MEGLARKINVMKNDGNPDIARDTGNIRKVAGGKRKVSDVTLVKMEKADATQTAVTKGWTKLIPILLVAESSRNDSDDDSTKMYLLLASFLWLSRP